MAQTLSTIRSLLAEAGLRPRHRLGQNFLHDANKLRRIVEAAELEPGELVLEVGPGTGTLTESLLAAGARVLAVEMDGALAALLRGRLGPDTERWRLLPVDVLADKHHLHPAVAEALARESAPFKLVANLPYQVASPLLATLALDWPAMRLAVVMVQEEVADRLASPPGRRTYGPLGILIQALFEVRVLTTLPPHCFWPRPRIRSAAILIERRQEPAARDPHRLAALLQRLFGQRRKQLGTILGRGRRLPAGIDPEQRPEQLSVEQLAALAEAEELPERHTGQRSAWGSGILGRKDLRDP